MASIPGIKGVSYAPYRGGFKLRWRELHETASRPSTGRASKRTGRQSLPFTINPIPSAQPAGSQRTWSVRMVQGHTEPGQGQCSTVPTRSRRWD